MRFKYNYNVKDLTVGSQFYLHLLKWWSEFCRKDNAFGNKNCHYFIWNNQEIRINNKPFFMKSILTLESELQTTFVLTLTTLSHMN